MMHIAHNAQTALTRTLVLAIAALALLTQPASAQPLQRMITASPVNPNPPVQADALQSILFGAPGFTTAADFTCPAGAFAEGEPSCALYSDRFNSGCYGEFGLQFSSTIACGQTVCGTYSMDGSLRDTDWYLITLTEQTNITVTITGEAQTVAAIPFGPNGTPDCSSFNSFGGFFFPSIMADAGETASFDWCLPAGSWWITVLPTFNQDPFCGSGAGQCCAERNYTLTVDCTDCTPGACCVDGSCTEVASRRACNALGGIFQGEGTTCTQDTCSPPANATCEAAQPIAIGDTVQVDLRNVVADSSDAISTCRADGGVGGAWYTFVGDGQEVTLSTCGSDLIDVNADDTVITVFRGDNCNIAVRSSRIDACNDNACGSNGWLSSATFNTVAGQTYFVQVMPWNESDRAIYQLSLTSSNPLPTPEGACCTEFGSCIIRDRDNCFESGYFYNGDGTTCDDIQCDGAGRANNTFCNSPEAVAVPSSTIGTNRYAFNFSVGTCGLPVTGGGAWYSFVGTGERVQVDTCSGTTNFDTVLHVSCDPCNTGNCVADNNNGPAGCGAGSQVTFCTELGVTYYVFVSGVNLAQGDFQLNITEVGTCEPGEAPPCVCPNGGNIATCFNAICDITCPQGSIIEGETICDLGYVDTRNGGCNAETPAWITIEPGQTICGQSGNYFRDAIALRDEDWMRVTIDQRSDVTFTLQSEFIHETAILSNDCGSPVAYDAAVNGRCGISTLSATLEPGTYQIVVRPNNFTGTNCGLRSTWTGSLQATPTASNGACCLSRCSCVITSEADCIAQFGEYRGDNTQCEAVCFDCPGDVDRDNQVDATDLNFVSNSYDVQNQSTGDLNCDTNVDIFDFLVVIEGYGQPCTSAPVTGACCIEGTDCIVTTDETCTGAGGTFLGPDTTCPTEGQPCGL